MSCKELCRHAGIQAAILTRVLSGERKDMVSANADRLRQAMRDLNKLFEKVDRMRSKARQSREDN